MVSFRLQLIFDCGRLQHEDLKSKEISTIADSFIQKIVEMPVLPRVGEDVMLGESRVTHNIVERIVDVECNVNLLEGVAAYAEDKEGWDLEPLYPNAKELFFQRLKEYEESLAQRQQS